MCHRQQSPEAQIAHQVRKAHWNAKRSGTFTDFAKLYQQVPREIVDLDEGEVLCAEIQSRRADRYYFSSRCLYLPQGEGFARLPYSSIDSLHWMTEEEYESKEVFALKAEHGDQLILFDSEGRRYEMPCLGAGFQLTFNFLSWLLHTRNDPETQDSLDEA